MTAIYSARHLLARGFTDQPKLRSTVAPSWRLVLLLGVLALVLLLTGCQTFPRAEATLKTGISANKGHAADETLPLEARTIAEKNGDLMWKVLFSIGGCDKKDIPADVLERQAERKRLRETGGSQ